VIEPPTVLLVAGTRPEAIKLAPVAERMAASGLLTPCLVAGGQHPSLVDQALAAFGRRPDITVRLDRRTGSQPELLARLAERLDPVVAASGAAAVVVQGDTTTTLAAALVAFWRRIPVVHLGAGLRSYDLGAPFPEEANRSLVARLAALHLAPTAEAAANLRREGVAAADVLVTGNTVVDAVTAVAARRAPYTDPRLVAVDAAARARAERLLLVTVHRRESWGRPLDDVLAAVRELAAGRQWLRVVLPAHPNPAVRAQVDAALAGAERILVTDPLPYSDFAQLLSVSHLVLSDSGGVQEEAPSFGVPVLVLRDVTERVEAIDAGCARLVGTDPGRVLVEASRLLDDQEARAGMVAAGNPFGDGRAAERSARAVAHLLGLAERPEELQRSVASLRPRNASAFRRVFAQPLRRRTIRTAARQQVT
jgi:UDP-N-acetylglucosamine 2-epimerase (non-hydrolysing)